MRLLVVVVNYKTHALVADCLDSLAGEVAGLDADVVVTDNASGDGSIEAVENHIASRGYGWARTMPLPRNGGFAYGNNAAVRPALASDTPPDFVLLLNPDTVVRPGAVTTLVDFMRENEQVGIAGSRLEDPDGTPQRSAFRFPTVRSEIDNGVRLGVVSKLFAGRVIAPPVPEAAGQVEWVAGASMMVRREVFEQAGLMDEAYFMYFEEVDFCRRAFEAGWPTWYVPASRVVHLVGQASGVTDSRQARKRRPAYWFESRRRYMLKNLGRLRTTLADASFLTGFALWRLRRFVQRKPDPDPANFLGDFAGHSVFRRGWRLG